MNEPCILYEKKDQVAILTLNRPQVMNALNEDLAESLRDHLERIEFDDSITCVILTGKGPGFMSGGDIHTFGEALRLDEAPRRARFHTFIQHVHPAIQSLMRMPKPVIAAVNGMTAGFGVSLMMACDLILASTKSAFNMAYCHMALSPDGGATFSLPRLVGRQKAMELALMGETLGAEEALHCGLINRLVPDEALMESALSLAKRLSLGPTGAYAETKRLINQSFSATLSEQLTREEAAFALCASKDTFKQAANAFLRQKASQHS